MQDARDRTREITDRRRLLVPVDDVLQDVNRFLRGWSGYFRYGNSARQFKPQLFEDRRERLKRLFGLLSTVAEPGATA